MAALIVLSANRDQVEARTKLLESISNDAMVNVVNRCLELGVSEGVLTQIASMALDSHAAQWSNATVIQQSGSTTRAI